MTINAGAKVFFRIIQMKGLHKCKIEIALQPFQGIFIGFIGSQIVSCRKDMTGIDTDTDTVFF